MVYHDLWWAYTRIGFIRFLDTLGKVEIGYKLIILSYDYQDIFVSKASYMLYIHIFIKLDNYDVES